MEKVAKGEELSAAEGLEAGLLEEEEGGRGAGLEEEDEGPPLGTEGEEEAGPGCLEKNPRRVDCFLDVEEEGGAALAIAGRGRRVVGEGREGRRRFRRESSKCSEVASRQRARYFVNFSIESKFER